MRDDDYYNADDLRRSLKAKFHYASLLEAGSELSPSQLRTR